MRIAATAGVERIDNPSSAMLIRADRGASTDLAGSHALDLDARRRLLEQRIELAKQRLVTDIGRAKAILVRAKDRAETGLVRAAIVAGALLLLGLTTVLVRRRNRRIRVTWR